MCEYKTNFTQVFRLEESINPSEHILLNVLHLYLYLVILQMLLSKATYNWGIHKAINLEEANIQRKCQ